MKDIGQKSAIFNCQGPFCGDFLMCMICVEFYNQRMTKAELQSALPEMVLFAKNEEEIAHFKKLQVLDNDEDLREETSKFVNNNHKEVKKITNR